MSKPAVQHRDTGKAAAEPTQSENYYNRCFGYFMFAHALITHECAGSCERIGKPNEPIVLANFVTPVEEVALLGALEVDNTAMHSNQHGSWRHAGSVLTRIYDSNVRSAAVTGASAFPDTIVSTVFERMRQVPELRHWRPDSVRISLLCSSYLLICLLSVAVGTQHDGGT
jgi:hypothetical protein